MRKGERSRTTFKWGCRFLLLFFAYLAGGGQGLGAQTTRIACGLCEEPDRFVRLQVTKAGAVEHNAPALSHPFRLSPADWKTILTSIKTRVMKPGLMGLGGIHGAVRPTFTGGDVKFLSESLNRAFARVQRNEWVVFELRSRASRGILEITSGGWFVEGLNLHLVLANFRSPITMSTIRDLLWENPLRSNSGHLFQFIPGKFQHLPPNKKPFGGLLGTPVPELAIAYQSILLPESMSSPSTTRSFGTSEPSSLKEEPSQSNLSLEEKLKILKRLRDQHLITEEDYQTKKKQMLDKF